MAPVDASTPFAVNPQHFGRWLPTTGGFTRGERRYGACMADKKPSEKRKQIQTPFAQITVSSKARAATPAEVERDKRKASDGTPEQD